MTNYFEYYSIPISLFPNLNTLKLKYYAYARKFHPDHNINVAKAEQMTAINNQAYQCLKKLECRMLHILEISGQWEKSDKTLPSEFLMDVMELQDGIMELSFLDPLLIVKEQKELELKIETFSDELTTECKNIDQNISLNDTDLLSVIETNLLKRRYLSRMRDNLDLLTTKNNSENN